MQNKHIKEFLNYYIGLPNPQYAVLLKGKWGSGKTHFINEYKNELNKNKQKYIYVSLYGVTSYDEIETKFLEAIYPRLYNKKTIFAGKIAKQLLKATLKIDWDGNQQENAEIEVKIPDLKPEDLLNTKDYILIFDDLERCSINIINLLGYINFFVEHQSYKVILIANEKELKKTKKYKTIKEKLIGKTFEFKTNSSLAYDSFLIELKNENRVKQNILEKQKSNILELFEKSQSNNLRALRQTLLDFERFYDEVLVKHQAKEELIKDILYWFFVFSFEIREGNNDILDLQKLSEEYYSLLFEEKTKEEAKKTKFKFFLNKYKLSDRFDVIISFDLWKEILLNSNIQKEEIERELKKSKYYFYESTSSWQKLIYINTIKDSEFEELLKDLYNSFSQNEYKDYNQFKYIASMLLDFQEEDLFNIEKDELFELVKTNFTVLFDEKIFNFEDIYFIENEFSALDANLRYRDKESFKKLQKYIDDFLEEKKKLKLKNDSKLIIQCIKEKNKSQLLDLLEGNDIRIINYKNIPILSEINVDDLFDAFVKTDGLIMHYFGGIIKGRYNHQTNELLSEKTTLQNLLDKIDEYLEKNQGKLSSYNLKKEVKENIEIALKYIENIEIQTNKV
ncbi:P-loop NTPase fold protein [Aliarcobacter cryaerophilus]|uniref:P-loop NTPase fold protein n=1 Tax=Aliarcobacter cryaerophilus TaxID=28198 RepID=UPI003DA2B876